MKKQSFLKANRLKSNKSIENLLRRGKFIRLFPLKVYYVISDNQTINSNISIKAAFITPKKQFKKAVDRNRIKRLMREAFRKNKELLIEKLNNRNINIELAFVFMGDYHFNYDIIEKQVVTLFNEI